MSKNSFRTALFTLLLLIASIFFPKDLNAAGRNISLIRDSEIEQALYIFAKPVFKKAGLNSDALRVHIVNDNSLNAFVASGMNMFFHTGLILETEHPGQLIGVIAHETGHVKGGHLLRLYENMKKAQKTSLVSTILGGVAAVATGRADVAAAVMMGGHGAIASKFMSYRRSEENAADLIAVETLDQLHMSAKGMLEFMQILKKQELTFSNAGSAYMRTHPLTKDRIAFIQNHVKNSKWSDEPISPELVGIHARIRAKLFAFMKKPKTTLIIWKEDNKSIEARYARSIAFFKNNELEKALKLINSLINDFPDDPYFHELKGQMLFENGHVTQSIKDYEKAVELLPNSALLRTALAQSLIETEVRENYLKAIPHLLKATKREKDNASSWRLLAIAWGRTGKMGKAAYAMAENYILNGNWEQALIQSKKALKLLNNNEPIRLRAEDAYNQSKNALKKKKKVGQSQR